MGQRGRVGPEPSTKGGARMSVNQRRGGGWGRVGGFVGSTMAGGMRTIVMLLVMVFVVASLVGDAKHTLGCLGLTSRQGEPPELQVRELDATRPDDLRMAASLARMADAAGIPAERLRVAVVVSDAMDAAAFDAASFLLFED